MKDMRRRATGTLFLFQRIIMALLFLSTRRGARMCSDAWNIPAAPVSLFVGQKWRFRCQLQQRSFVRLSQIQMMPEGPEVRTVVDQLQQGGAIGRRLVDIQFLSGRYVRHGRPTGFDSFARTMTPFFQPHNAPELSAMSVDIIQDWNAKGKFIYIVLDDGSASPPSDENKDDDFQRSIWITLGMSGQFVNESVHQQDTRFARWFLELLDPATGQQRKVFYHDQRNFGTLRFSLSRKELEDKLASLGPDILDPSNTTEDDFMAIVDNLRNPGTNVCKFLMNQKVRMMTLIK
jgi:formamidopyrimidine-DNA glycosylase